MTFRAKPVQKRSSRSSRDERGRRSLYINLAFVGVIVAALLILVGAAGATWWGDNFGKVATVNGTDISRSEYRTRYAVEAFRIDQARGRLRDEYQAGRITETERDAGLTALDRQEQSLPTVALERLVDAELQRQLAPDQGVTVSEAEIDDRLVAEATREEQRRVWVIEVEPEVSDDADEPTAEQVAAARTKADEAAAELAGGAAFEEVAKEYSTAPSASQGGDLGWLTEDTSLDPLLDDAVFAAEKDVPTAVIEGEDGVFRIGRASDIAPATVDQAFEQKVIDAGIAIVEYRRVVESDVRRTKLDEAITAGVTETATPQRRLNEIYVAPAQGAGDEVKVSHILYAPNDDPSQEALAALEDDDPAWDKAKADAQVAYEKLLPSVGQPALAEEFAALAKAESDEPGADTSGGELPYFTRDQLDSGFGDAIFAPGLEPGDLLGPTRSQFGWHVILFEERRADPKGRIDTAKIRVDTGEDFAVVAKEVSESATADAGGALGWVARLQLDAALEEAVFATPVGETTDPLESPDGGWYLFQVVEEETRLPDGDQIDTLEASAFSNWYAAQKAEAEIDRVDDLPTVEV